MTNTPGTADTDDSMAPARASPVPTSLIIGDRACIRCGFNLHGQPVEREPHYGLAMARCPECGQPAALQEHPVLSRWAGRLGMALAGVWLLCVLGAFALPAVAMAGVGYGLSTLACRSLSTPIAAEFLAFLRTERDAMTEDEYAAQYPYFAGWIDLAPEDLPYVDADWWSRIDLATRVPDAGLIPVYDWRAARGWVAACMLTCAGGIVLGVALAHLRVRGLVAAGLLIGALAAATLLVLKYHQPWLGLNTFGWGVVDLSQALRAEFGLPFQLITVGVQTAALTAGLLLARPVARWLVALLLPPRLRTPLGFLWSMDGLPQPRPPQPQPRPPRPASPPPR